MVGSQVRRLDAVLIANELSQPFEISHGAISTKSSTAGALWRWRADGTGGGVGII
jgi:hypothetical protein